LNVLQLHWHQPNPAGNLARAGLGRISGKWPESAFAGSEIQCNPTVNRLLCALHAGIKLMAYFGENCGKTLVYFVFHNI